MYDPTNAQVRVYDLPGDLNGFFGIAWDAQRRRVWVSQSDSLAYGPGSALVSFDPELVPFETFSWTPGLPGQTAQSTFAFATTARFVVLVLAATVLAGWGAARHATRQPILTGIQAE